MAAPERVLIDTSALYAIVSATDLFHARARDAYEMLLDGESEFWTTSYVLVETVALLHRRLGFEAVTAFDAWRRGAQLRVLWVDDEMHAGAWDAFAAEQGRGLSLVDWTMALASREMSAPVFTFDADFAAQGIPVEPR